MKRIIVLVMFVLLSAVNSFAQGNTTDPNVFKIAHYNFTSIEIQLWNGLATKTLPVPHPYGWAGMHYRVRCDARSECDCNWTWSYVVVSPNGETYIQKYNIEWGGLPRFKWINFGGEKVVKVTKFDGKGLLIVLLDEIEVARFPYRINEDGFITWSK